MDRNITLSPVFIEPKFKHSFLLSSQRYFYILIFEVVVALVLLNYFFKEEILNSIPSFMKTHRNPLSDLLDKTTLRCDDTRLMISKPTGDYPALNIDGTPTRLYNCGLLLSTINGAPATPYSIFNRR
ncbi:ORF-80 [Teiidae poxvirus 1]|nr:ORF-80 [Teiidae poxvirus 1]